MGLGQIGAQERTGYFAEETLNFAGLFELAGSLPCTGSAYRARPAKRAPLYNAIKGTQYRQSRTLTLPSLCSIPSPMHSQNSGEQKIVCN